jgi:hypothetical protein
MLLQSIDKYRSSYPPSVGVSLRCHIKVSQKKKCPTKFFHHEPGNEAGMCGMLFHDNLFCGEFGPDLLGKVFSNLARMYEIRVDFWRDSRILVQ